MLDKNSYHHGDLRRTLIEEAIASVEKKGPGNLKLRDLSSGAGVSRAAPYRHFSSKENLLAVVAAEGFRRLREKCIAIDSQTAEDHLEQLGARYLDFARANPGLYSLMFDPNWFVPPVNSELLEASNDAFSTLQSALREFPGDQASELNAAAVWAMVHGLATLIKGRMTGMIGIHVHDSAEVIVDQSEKDHEISVKHALKVLSLGISAAGKEQ